MKYLIFFILVNIISNPVFSDEFMSCKINDNQSLNFKLEENLLSQDKIFGKSGTKWLVECPCENVENKSVSCIENQKFKDCKKDKNPFFKLESNVWTIDFEMVEFRVKFNETETQKTFNCKLIE
jgi:hypothetical protein